MKTLFVFDIDDTIAETAALHQKAFVKALKYMGVQSMDTNFNDYLNHTDSFIAGVIYETYYNAKFTSTVLDEFESILTDQIINQTIEEIKGAIKTIELINNTDDYYLCYATGSLLKPATFKLKQLGINHFEKVLSASNIFHKREDIVKDAISKSKKAYDISSFDKIIALGDGIWDLKTANNLDIEFIGVGEKHKKILKEKGAKIHYKDLSLFNLSEIENDL